MSDIDARDWLLPGSRKDDARISSDWVAVPQPLIDGVTFRETRPVLTAYGHLVELFRGEWSDANRHVDQVFSSTLEPGAVSAWHAHEHTVDRIAVPAGTLHIVLFDARARSPTCGRLNQFRISPLRPALLTIPAQVWHGIQNVGAGPAVVINAVDRAYDYDAPDHWRVDPDSPQIPFRFRVPR